MSAQTGAPSPQAGANPAGSSARSPQDAVAADAALRRRSRALAAAVIGLFLALGFVFTLVVPPFETPDEPFHYGFARHIAQGNGLPVQSNVETGPWAQEGSQAPLYYLVTGLLTRWIDQGDFETAAVRNPRANIGDPLDPGNKNFMLYSGKQGPLVGSNLALHVGRWFSLLLGAVTLWCIYLTVELGVRRRQGHPQERSGGDRGRESLGSERYDLALLAVAFVAAIPQFLFISASFTNDTLIIAAAAATVYWLARLLAKSPTEPIAPYEWLVLGALLGVAALSKLQGLGLVPLSGLVVLFLAWRRRTWRIVLDAVLWVGIPAAIVAGWWYVRNVALYGDWSGLGHLTAINGQRTEPLTWEGFWPEFRGLRFSFWGLFGWFNILLPNWFYTAADILTAIGAAGVVGVSVQLIRRSPRPLVDEVPVRLLALLIGWAVLMFVLLLYWILRATGSQGRLIFPGVIAYGILLVLGVDFWLRLLPAMLRRLAWALLLGTMVGVSLYTVASLLPRTYDAPAPIAALPPNAQQLDFLFAADGAIGLEGIEVSDGRYRPGERVGVTLYWRAEQQPQIDYEIFVQLLDESGREVANLTTHPGWGRNPTTFWQPGALYADPYSVLVEGPIDPASPLLARVYTGLIDPATAAAGNLPVRSFNSDGEALTPFAGFAELEAWQRPSVEELGLQRASAGFGGVITLGGYAAPAALAAGDSLTATLLWEAKGQPAADYTAYLHLLDAEGKQVGGYDRPPAGERFPTSHWRAGDRIAGEYTLQVPPDLPPGEYALWVGLYETASGGTLRLPVTDAGGLPSGDGQVQIGSVTVSQSP